MPSIPAPALFGREEDLARAEDALRNTRVLTISGPAGIGKSAFARALLSKDDEKVVIANVGDAKDRPGALRRIARAAGLSGKTRVDAVAGAVAGGPSRVIVIDDADPVLAAIASFAHACLALGRDTKIVVTSREPLGIEGEAVFSLGPISIDAGVLLFHARAGAGTLDEDARAIALLFEGIPLAIELAAWRTELVSPKELLARKDERLRLLRAERRDVHERHTALALSLAWSLDTASADERRAFVAMGAFEGACTLDAFEAVAGPGLTEDPIDCAQALLRKSLLTRAAGTGATRIAMLRTVRAFAREIDGDEERAVRAAADQRHAMFFLDRAERASSQAYGERAEEALVDLEMDLFELLGAFERTRHRNPEIAARIAIALMDLFLFRDVIDLRAPLFAEAVAAADASKNASLASRARVLAAKVSLEVGQSEAARAMLADAVTQAETAKDEAAAADARRSLGWAALAMGDADGAREALSLALAHYEKHGDARGRADVLAALGVIAFIGGERDEGRDALISARAIHVDSGDTIRREKIEEMATLFGLALADETVEEADLASKLRLSIDVRRAQGRTLREAIDRVRLAALESRDRDAEAKSLREPSAARPWEIGADARFIVSPAGERTDLVRHGSLRLVLEALVNARLTSAGTAITADALLTAGWPGEKVRYDAGMLRVYTAMRRLRKMGLADAIVTRDDGYLIDPRVPLVRGHA